MGHGKKLFELLQHNKMTVTELSRKTGISTNTLYSAIKRDGNLNSDALERISKSLGFTLDELNQLLKDNDNQSKTISPRVLDEDFDDTLSQSRNLIEKLNFLTRDYQESLYKLNQLETERHAITMQLRNQEKRLQEVEMEIAIVKNDVENRQLELNLIRNRIAE